MLDIVAVVLGWFKSAGALVLLAACGSAAAFDIGLPQDLKVLVAKQTAEQKAEERRQIQAAQVKRLDAAVDKWLAKPSTAPLSDEAKKWYDIVTDENLLADRFYDYCCDHKDELQSGNITISTVRNLVFLFRRTLAQGFHFHSRILEHLTPANVTRIVAKLEKM